MADKNLSYFLAANSGEGFFCIFNELYEPREGWKLYIIKGGPGTGKSGIMKKICKKAEELGYTYHAVYCSSDPDSLDGVILPEIKVSICDGTSPHIMEPVYPGVSEIIVNLGECWNDKMLFDSREHIMMLTDCNKAVHKQSGKYLSAAAKAQNDNEKIINACADYKKIENYALRNITKCISCKNNLGAEKRIFLNAVTPKGKYTFINTVSELCDKIISVTDEFVCISSLLMKTMGQIARANGADVILCLNPLRPSSNPIHLILPEQRICYVSSCDSLNFKPIATKNINAARFINKDKLSVYKNRLSFNQKISDKFENEAIDIMKKAKSVHDELEKYYIGAMNFDKIDKITESLINRIFGLS